MPEVRDAVLDEIVAETETDADEPATDGPAAPSRPPDDADENASWSADDVDWGDPFSS